VPFYHWVKIAFQDSHYLQTLTSAHWPTLLYMEETRR
jgi:hypothetical protein